MLSIPTKKFSADTPPRRRRSRFFRSIVTNQQGQGFLEYMLVLLVVLGVLFVAARPVIQRLQKKFEKSLQGGIFKEDPSGANFYYFPLK